MLSANVKPSSGPLLLLPVAKFKGPRCARHLAAQKKKTKQRSPSTKRVSTWPPVFINNSEKRKKIKITLKERRSRNHVAPCVGPTGPRDREKSCTVASSSSFSLALSSARRSAPNIVENARNARNYPKRSRPVRRKPRAKHLSIDDCIPNDHHDRLLCCGFVFSLSSGAF